MASDVFLRIEGIPGESTDGEYGDWIEIAGYSHGLAQQVSSSMSSSGGLTSERCDHGQFTVQKFLDKASVKLSEFCSQGSTIDEIELCLNRAAGGGQRVKYMTYLMKHVLVAGYSVGGGDSGVPMETVNFAYGTIEWTYTQQLMADGTGGGQISAGWDCEQNQPI